MGCWLGWREDLGCCHLPARERLRNVGNDPAVRPLYEVVPATLADASRAFGEPLPNGLRLGADGDRAPSVS